MPHLHVALLAKLLLNEVEAMGLPLLPQPPFLAGHIVPAKFMACSYVVPALPASVSNPGGVLTCALNGMISAVRVA